MRAGTNKAGTKNFNCLVYPQIDVCSLHFLLTKGPRNIKTIYYYTNK